MRVVGHAQLVGDSQQQRIGLGDRLVLLELFDQGIRLGGVAAAEDCARVRVNKSDLVVTVTCAPEISAIAIVGQCNDAPDPTLADRVRSRRDLAAIRQRLLLCA